MIPPEGGSLARDRIRIAIVGVGNCASSLVQGIAYYAEREAGEAIGLMHFEIGGFRPGDIVLLKASRGVKLEKALETWTAKRAADA